MEDKIKIRPGWTREMMKERVRKYVPDRGCMGNNPETGMLSCFYRKGEFRCAQGAMMTDEANALCALNMSNIQRVLEDYGRTEEIQAGLLGPFLSAYGAGCFQREHDDAALEGTPNIPNRLCNWIDTYILEDHEA
jgi:hypothetical protein